MIFLEAYARPLLLLHALGGAVVVGSTTHQLIWSRAYRRGEFGRHRSEKRFVTILVIAYALNFLVGNLLYPTFKVRVRSEYLDDVRAVVEQAKLRDAQALGEPRTTVVPGSLSNAGRAFDIKEHCAALGFAAAIGLYVLRRRSHPHEVPAAAPLYLSLSLFACVTSWVALLVGLYVTSLRAVGS